MVALTTAICSGAPKTWMRSIIGVSVMPGITRLTRIRSFATRALRLSSCHYACLDIVYADVRASRGPWIDDVITTEPPPRRHRFDRGSQPQPHSVHVDRHDSCKRLGILLERSARLRYPRSARCRHRQNAALRACRHRPARDRSRPRQARNGAADASGGRPIRARPLRCWTGRSTSSTDAPSRANSAPAPTDAAGAAGDDGDLALQPAHAGSPPDSFGRRSSHRRGLDTKLETRRRRRTRPSVAGFASDQYSRTPLDWRNRRLGSSSSSAKNLTRPLVVNSSADCISSVWSSR